MDSVTTRRTPAPDAAAPDAALDAPAARDAGATSRLDRFVPAVRAAVRAAWRTSAAGALGAAAVWAALFERSLAAGGVSWGVAAVVAAVLLVPSGAAALLGWTLGGLVALPGEIRDAARGVAVPTRAAGVGGLFRTVWALRGLVSGSAEAWARTAGLARLASLPFVLGLLALVALNGVVVVAGIVALVVLVL